MVEDILAHLIRSSSTASGRHKYVTRDRTPERRIEWAASAHSLKLQCRCCMRVNHQGIETCQTGAIQRLLCRSNNQAAPYNSIIIMLIMLILNFYNKNFNEYNRRINKNEKCNLRIILNYICKNWWRPALAHGGSSDLRLLQRWALNNSTCCNQGPINAFQT